jgi:hypothetical protein
MSDQSGASFQLAVGLYSRVENLRHSSRRNSSAQIKNRHAHGQTVRDLIENHTLVSIGQLTVDLVSAVDRTRMHDQAIGLL